MNTPHPMAGEVTNVTLCKKCGMPIRFIRTAKGNSMPIDDIIYYVTPDPNGKPFMTTDGRSIKAREDDAGEIVAHLSHFATCPFADQFKGRRHKNGSGTPTR